MYTVLRTYSMYSFNFWVKFLILVWLNFRFARSFNKRIMEGKIISGQNALIRDHAHAVLIQVIRNDVSHICGSSVLNQKFLLSAAHCFEIEGYFKTLAFAGHEDVRKSRISRLALKTIVHKKFEAARSVRNDIALIVLKKELPLNSNIKRIIIKRSFPRGVTGSLVGWGLINEETLEETNLLKLITQKVRGKECKLIHVEPGMFCAGSRNSSKPTASLGDSGSGLVTNKYQLIGILSYKMHEYPALPVYTNVSHFYSWIKKCTSHCYWDKKNKKTNTIKKKKTITEKAISITKL